MEPILPMPNNLERTTSVPDVQPAPGALGSLEGQSSSAQEQIGEHFPAAPASPTPVATQAPDPAVQPQTPAVPVLPAQPVTDPLIADDVDVIEKEWVDKAKKIVSATKEDPYQQEKEVSKLQANYLMKRYNKKMKITE